MNFSKILVLTTLTITLASTGCAVGSEDHELPTPQPAHEFSAPLNPTDNAAAQTPVDVGIDQAAELYDTPPPQTNPYLDAIHKIQTPIVVNQPSH